MQTEEFVNRVAESSEIADNATAKRLTIATIEALCLHLSQEEVRRLASQLPRELSEAAQAGSGQQEGEAQSHVELSQFYHEVAMRAELPHELVPLACGAVLETFSKAISRGELVDVAFDLPPRLNTLFAG